MNEEDEWEYALADDEGEALPPWDEGEPDAWDLIKGLDRWEAERVDEWE